MTPEQRKRFVRKERGERDDRPKGKNPNRSKPWEYKKKFPTNRPPSDSRRHEGKREFKSDFNPKGDEFRQKLQGNRSKPWDHKKKFPANRPPNDSRRHEGGSTPQSPGRFDRKNKNYPPWKSRPRTDDRTGNTFGRDSRKPRSGDSFERGDRPRQNREWTGRPYNDKRDNRKPRSGDSFERGDRPRQNREWTGRPFNDKRRKQWNDIENKPPREKQVEHRTDAAETKPVIVGRKPVLEAIRAGTQIDRILILHGIHGGIIEGIEAQARQKHIRLQEVDREQFTQIAGDEHAQGVAAIIARRKQASVEDILERGKQRGEQGLVLILDEIEDPHNLGALIRTAECSGFHGVVIPRHHSAPITSTVVKSSAGATEHLPIAEVANLVTVIDDLKKSGFWVIGLDMEGDKLYTQADFSNPTALVVGSEGKGIRRLVKDHCDVLVKIPLHGMIGSLNASVAGALVMFEARKTIST